LGSFEPNIPNGWHVRFSVFEGIDEKRKYTWQDGQVVDEKGRKVDLAKLKPKTITQKRRMRRTEESR
jgi:hypothetical protein